MVWTAERTTVNQKIQIGPEAAGAHGTPVAAGKLLECFDVVMGIEADVVFYTPTGFKYATEEEENTEWMSATWGGAMDYNGILYPLASAMGSVSPVAHLASSTAKDWIFTPPVTGSLEPETYTVQQGDSVRAHQTAYVLFNEVGYTLTRKATSFSGKTMSQAISDGATLTNSPTAVALAPVPGKHVNVYLDSTSAGIGTTQLMKPLQVQYSFSNIYGPFFPINRTNASFTAHVDLKPTATVKLKIEADATGMALLTNLQAGSTQYLRIDALGTTAIASDGPGNIYNEIKHDMAVKVGKPTAFSDDSGIFAIEWELTLVNDPAWNSGQSQKVTVTNLITAL